MIKKTEHITIKDIAKRAGVSISTVSRALDPGKKNLINMETRQKIERIAKESDFSFNLVARRFKRQKSEAITLVFPQSIFRKPFNIDFSAHDGILAWQILEGVLKGAKSLRYDVKVEPLFAGADPAGIAESIGFPNSDGVLLYGTYEMEGLIAEIKAKNIPFLVLNTFPTRDYTIPEVAVDVGSGIWEALEYFMDGGHKKIAYLSIGSISLPVYNEKFNAFKLFMEGQGIFRKDMVFLVNNTTDVKKLVSSFKGNIPFSAVLCSNDTLASIFIGALRENGLDVPGDVSVIGYNNNPVFCEGEDALSSVNLPRCELGEIAAKTLIEVIGSGIEFEGKKLIPSSFIPGKTSRQLK